MTTHPQNQRSYSLTFQEANLIKDILKIIGADDEMNAQFAEGLKMPEDVFNEIADKTFEKLGNGQVIEMV
jgi:hypothetical protein